MNTAQPMANLFDSVPSMHTRPDSAALVAEFLKSQQPFLTENLKNVVAGTKKQALQCLRVTKSSGATVGNIASDLVLIRFMMPDAIEDGAYMIAKEVTKLPPRSYWSGYPDVELARPDFEEMAKYAPVLMSRDLCGQFLTFCQAVRSVRGQVLINKECAYMVQDRTKVFNFPFGIVTECVVNPDQLIPAFKEAQRYEAVYIARQKSEDRSMPLVVGLNWNNCVLVSTQSAHVYYQENMNSW